MGTSLENVMTEIRSIQQALQKTQKTVADEKPDKLIENVVENLSGRVKTIQAQLDGSEEERSKLEKKVSETSERFVEMVANNSTELTTVKADMKDLKKAMEESQNDINENKENTEKRLVQMKTQSIGESEGHSQLQDRMATLEGKYDGLEGRVTSINQTLEESSHKWSSIEREVRGAETNRLPAENEKLIDQLQESIERFEKQAVQKESDACVKEKENKESLESLQQGLADVRQVILDRKPKIDVDSGKAPLKQLETEITSLHHHLAGVDDLLKTWQGESERVKNGEKELDALAAKVDELITVNAAEMSGIVTNVANLETGCKQISSSVERNMEQIADLHLQLEREKREKEEMVETVMSKLSADSAKKVDI